EGKPLIIMQVDRITLVRVECFHRCVNPGCQISAGRQLVRQEFASGQSSPPLTRAELDAIVGPAPIHINMVGDAMNPGSDGRSSGKSGQRLPDASEGLLGEVGGISVVGAEATKKGVNALVELFNDGYGSLGTPVFGLGYQLS